MTPQSKWNKSNLDKMRAATAKWRDKHREEARAGSRQWKKTNPAKHAALQMKRKSAKLQRTPHWANLDRIQEVYKESSKMSIKTGILHHVDHIIPLQGEFVSGLHVENNLQILPAIDNIRKGNKFEEH